MLETVQRLAREIAEEIHTFGWMRETGPRGGRIAVGTDEHAGRILRGKAADDALARSETPKEPAVMRRPGPATNPQAKPKLDKADAAKKLIAVAENVRKSMRKLPPDKKAEMRAEIEKKINGNPETRRMLELSGFDEILNGPGSKPEPQTAHDLMEHIRETHGHLPGFKHLEEMIEKQNKKKDLPGKVVDFISKFEQDHPSQFATLPDIYQSLAKPAGISIGDFHDQIRQLASEGRIRLHPYTRALYTIKDEDQALVAGQEIKYYASVPDRAANHPADHAASAPSNANDEDALFAAPKKVEQAKPEPAKAAKPQSKPVDDQEKAPASQFEFREPPGGWGNGDKPYTDPVNTVEETMKVKVSPERKRKIEDALTSSFAAVDPGDGLVDLNRLYSEAKRTATDMTLPEFRKTLLDLWDQKKIQLHGLNEIREVKDKRYGIWSKDEGGYPKAYYHFAFLNKPEPAKPSSAGSRV